MCYNITSCSSGYTEGSQLEQIRMNASAHPFMSSSSFVFTKSGSYITDIKSVSNRSGVGNKSHPGVTDIQIDFDDTHGKTILSNESKSNYSNKTVTNSRVTVLQGESSMSEGNEESNQGKFNTFRNVTQEQVHPFNVGRGQFWFRLRLLLTCAILSKGGKN
ncbi:hypothetical protein Btru_061766 [Bulinus truncatus]|nr:hypothetical protein Btru_061766 [Bulinus truncatus]